jgi:tRNA (guanine37-N1)-methyltransferase
MKSIDVLTLFPQLFGPFLAEGVLGRALREERLAVALVNFRDHGLGRHRSVDDVPYGGGAGMVLRPEPIFAAVRERVALHRAAGRRTRTVLLSPQGARFDQARARALAAGEEALLLVCGRYEGFDERIRLGLADEELSLGDFVMQGGEVAAMAVIEAVARLLPGVLGNPDSPAEESFAGDGLEYPHYTRPAEFEGMTVPEVLCSGNHARIDAWRREQATQRTAVRRPDLRSAAAAPTRAEHPGREDDAGEPIEANPLCCGVAARDSMVEDTAGPVPLRRASGARPS